MRNVYVTEHTMATTLEDVGKQVSNIVCLMDSFHKNKKILKNAQIWARGYIEMLVQCFIGKTSRGPLTEDLCLC